MKRLFTVVLLAIALLPISNVTAAGPQAEPQKQTQKTTQGNPDTKVWVNTGSGVYHCPGTRWYGNTKRGEYMTQKEAQQKGYRPAYGKVCQ